MAIAGLSNYLKNKSGHRRKLDRGEGAIGVGLMPLQNFFYPRVSFGSLVDGGQIKKNGREWGHGVYAY